MCCVKEIGSGLVLGVSASPGIFVDGGVRVRYLGPTVGACLFWRVLTGYPQKESTMRTAHRACLV